MKRRFFVLFAIFLIFGFYSLKAQSSFSVDEYANFLSTHANMTAEDLMNLHPAGFFKDKISFPSDVKYLDSVSIKYSLTDYEKSLLKKHGFVVTERVDSSSFFSQMVDIYHKDLPLFISTDGILHAIHSSYDELLKNIEVSSLVPRLQSLISRLREEEETLQSKYSDDTLFAASLRDVDLYITVAQKLLGQNATPIYAENDVMFNKIISCINSLSVNTLNLFSDNSLRTIDFSQFKVRGHYNDKNYPILGNYFQTMMWLGRIEFYLIPPKGNVDSVKFKDVRRQIIDSYLLEELFKDESAARLYNEIEKTIMALVGEQDNVTLNNLEEMKDSLGIENISFFEDSANVKMFQDYLARQSFANQKILSHILFAEPFSPDSLEPASAFLPFGQRFVIDSYITGNVVFDKIKYLGRKIFRALPKTLDVLFSLGNNAAAQLLTDEIDKYHYASNLAALRHLVDTYDESFWEQSVYNIWLKLIRSLSPLENRENLPPFMQTAAWNQEKMNTQLASWTELRHDNLLYAKQSYTGGMICSYPYVYVEPIPQFFQALSDFGKETKERLENIGLQDAGIPNVLSYLENVDSIGEKLKTIAEKELNGVPFTDEEIKFLKSAIKINNDGMCGSPNFNGWYTELYLDYSMREENLFDKDYVVADYHTSPTDESGNMVGWVAHAGTGPVNLAVVVAQLPSGENVTFCGPVASYYEYTTLNFQRLNDAEWDSLYLAMSTRPDWVNLYLADKDGNSRGSGKSLLTQVNEPVRNQFPSDYILTQNFPNPFGEGSASHSGYTTIAFNVPQNFDGQKFKVEIFDITGREVAEIFNRTLYAGNYLIRWNGRNKFGRKVASGVYIYRISTTYLKGKSNRFYSVERKMNFIK